MKKQWKIGLCVLLTICMISLNACSKETFDEDAAQMYLHSMDDYIKQEKIGFTLDAEADIEADNDTIHIGMQMDVDLKMDAKKPEFALTMSLDTNGFPLFDNLGLYLKENYLYVNGIDEKIKVNIEPYLELFIASFEQADTLEKKSLDEIKETFSSIYFKDNTKKEIILKMKEDYLKNQVDMFSELSDKDSNYNFTIDEIRMILDGNRMESYQFKLNVESTSLNETVHMTVEIKLKDPALKQNIQYPDLSNYQEKDLNSMF